MKGSPDAPRCGFSRTLVGLLRDEAIEFSSFDILEDQDVRQALKELSNWPTYPQVKHAQRFANSNVTRNDLVQSNPIERENVFSYTTFLATSRGLSSPCAFCLSVPYRLSVTSTAWQTQEKTPACPAYLALETNSSVLHCTCP